MRAIDLVREPSTDKGTFGEMFEGAESICKTIERPWLENKNGVSCIPEGSYVMKLVDTPHHGFVYEVQDVPNRTAILIHVANVMTDLEGCIGVGSYIADSVKNGLPGVTNSSATFKLFMDRFKGEGELMLNVKWREA